MLLISRSIELGEVPKEIKKAKVIPIYKSKDHHVFSNYRPISLLPTFSKILERVIYNRMYNFLTVNDAFCCTQCNFGKKSSNVDAAAEFVKNTLTALDNNEYSISVFLNISKALDTMNYEILFINWNTMVLISRH